jgi:hypothetical protein
VALVGTDIVEDCIVSIIMVKRIIELRKTLVVTGNVVPGLLIPFSLEWRQYILPKHWFLQKSHIISPEDNILQVHSDFIYWSSIIQCQQNVSKLTCKKCDMGLCILGFLEEYHTKGRFS